ncbi:intradiol ring-cleavage dioxygenase [Citricoccus sp. K5]|uniref:intradiol ring-cleavage dioxygenase n=1 Tax=Citricoccus sp. K5 TaxID=2653135 RepID=UPI0012F209A5|nr:intradiol ring-cleavage dioxygenase [Citricoccus sp. K5]VXB00044.1 Protocatechuate 3,4-dioxygenase beta subunit [Citricoccus sp. K5]
MRRRENSKLFEGRMLDRPEEDVEDQGLAFDLGTLVSRRKALGAFGLGAGAVLLAACAPVSEQNGSTAASASGSPAASSSASSAQAELVETPGETAGPYSGDGSNGPDVLEESGVERSDITSSIDGGATAEGVPLTLTMNIIDMAGGNVPMTGAAVYVWHCDAAGQYSMYSDAVVEETYLRGVQVAGEDGTVTFTTIFPGCYTGRWPHIHFEVFPDLDSITDATNAVLTSQIAMAEASSSSVFALEAYAGSAENLAQVTLASDNVFSDDSAAQQLGTTTGSVQQGYTVTIDVPIDTTTEPSTDGMPPAGGAGNPGGAPPSGCPGGQPPSR